ncbi:MAG: hypothetical protein MUO58_16340 [Anaerolineales bacterium]|nr:hypothetical protein [Anaerolineales bacterium]
MPKQVGQQVIAAMQSSPMRPTIALVEDSVAASAAEDLAGGRDRGTGWADGAGLVRPRATSSVSVPVAGLKSLTSPGSHVHGKYAQAVAPK